MIIHNHCHHENLKDYGIEIPIYPNVAKRVYQELIEITPLKPHKHYWHTDSLLNISKDDLLAVHSAKYINQLFSDSPDQEIITAFELHKNGKPHRYSPDNACLPFSNLVKKRLYHVSGTYTSMRNALLHKFSYFLGGGGHHARHDSGNGFCLLNDIVIGIKKLQRENSIKNCLIVDVDAHMGDGTAELTQADGTIKTLSIHMKNGWPLDGTFNKKIISSDYDIPISVNENYLYLEKLKSSIKEINFNNIDLVVVVNGSDPFEQDILDSSKGLMLTLDCLLKRDLFLYNTFTELNIPQAYVMAGGYGPNVWKVYFQFLKSVLTEMEDNGKWKNT